MRSRVLRATLLLLVVALAGCGRPSASFDVIMTDFAFSPASYNVVGGSEVILTLTNRGAVVHNWVMLLPGSQVTSPFDEDDEPRVLWRARVQAGETETFTFTAPQSLGEYPIVCTEPGHYEAGMVGRLTVTP
ncbi:MAG TPA: plastocyanin/azurin family copper-binding protein [Anaerolineales bacterium]